MSEIIHNDYRPICSWCENKADSVVDCSHQLCEEHLCSTCAKFIEMETMIFPVCNYHGEEIVSLKFDPGEVGREKALRWMWDHLTPISLSRAMSGTKKKVTLQ